MALSIAIYTTMAMFGFFKFKQLIYRENPNIIVYEEPDYLPSSYSMSATQKAARVALAVASPYESEPVLDPRYLTMIAHFR